MKVLLLIRHAKSVAHTASYKDFDRSLSHRGYEDAPEMARRLLKQHIAIDQFVSSPANRAKTTASLFIKEYKRNENEILLIPELYHPAPEVFADVISSIDNTYNSAAIFSHNPGITDFAFTLTNKYVVNMPTCAVYGVSAAIDKWTDFALAEKEFLLFDFPKQEFNE